MTMTTTAAQELLRGDAQIEAPPVGGRMREASATSAHLHSFFVSLVGGPHRKFNEQKIPYTWTQSNVGKSMFETIKFWIQENDI